MDRTLAARGRGKGPWCELDRGPTVKERGDSQGKEVITMAVVATLIAGGLATLLILGILLVVAVGWFISASL
jgi:hypothetical protein